MKKMKMATLPTMTMTEEVEKKIVFSEGFPFVLECTVTQTRVANYMLGLKMYNVLSLTVYQ